MKNKLLVFCSLMCILPCSCKNAEQTFTVTWKNYDGTILEKDENVVKGTTPSYDGAKPTKANQGNYCYTFLSWDKPLDPVNGDIIYTAVFDEQIVGGTITWLNYDGSVLLEENYPFGEIPSYSGATPTKPGNEDFSYVFDHWSPEPVEVTKDASYTAIFNEIPSSDCKHIHTVNCVCQDCGFVFKGEKLTCSLEEALAESLKYDFYFTVNENQYFYYFYINEDTYLEFTDNDVNISSIENLLYFDINSFFFDKENNCYSYYNNGRYDLYFRNNVLVYYNSFADGPGLHSAVNLQKAGKVEQSENEYGKYYFLEHLNAYIFYEIKNNNGTVNLINNLNGKNVYYSNFCFYSGAFLEKEKIKKIIVDSKFELSYIFNLLPQDAEIELTENSSYVFDCNGIIYSKDYKNLVFYPSNLELETFTIPDTVEIVFHGCFHGTKYLKNLYLGKNVIFLNNCFLNCESLENLYLANNDNITFDKYILHECPNLKLNDYLGSKYLGTPSNPYYYLVSFYYDSNLATHTVHNQCEIIGSSCTDNYYYYYAHAGLLDIPDSVRVIKRDSGLGFEQINFGSGLEVVDELMLSMCHEISLNPNNKHFVIKDGCFLSADLKTLYKYIGICDGILTLPDGIENIIECSFYGCSFTNIIFPESLKQINRYSFYRCSHLTKIIFSENIQSVNFDAFYECNSIEEIVLNDKITSFTLGSHESLKYFYIGAGLNTLRWKNLNVSNIVFDISPDNKTFDIFEGNLVSKDHTVLYLVLTQGIGVYKVPSYITYICTNFMVRLNYDAVFVPKTVKYIEGRAIDYGSLDCFYVEATKEECLKWNYDWNHYIYYVAYGYTGEEVTYEFETFGGDNIEPIKIKNILFDLPTPTNCDLHFVGWYDNPEFAGDPIKYYYNNKGAKFYAKFLNDEEYYDGSSSNRAKTITIDHVNYSIDIKFNKIMCINLINTLNTEISVFIMIDNSISCYLSFLEEYEIVDNVLSFVLPENSNTNLTLYSYSSESAEKTVTVDFVQFN